MDTLTFLVDFILHLDKHLAQIISDYGTWTYALLFLIIFVETGVVLMPFLPGDSLLFAAGAFAATGSFNVLLLWLLLTIAAILGDTVNYWLGNKFGQLAFNGRIRFLNQSHLHRTQSFFAKHGGKAVVLARYVPIVRTFAPFVAGAGAMDYGRFVLFNVTGGLSWVTIFLFGGYFFGNLPIVRDNFSLVILAVIILSLIPIAVEFIQHRRQTALAATTQKKP
jgi:membrane-associated protein